MEKVGDVIMSTVVDVLKQLAEKKLKKKWQSIKQMQ